MLTVAVLTQENYPQDVRDVSCLEHKAPISIYALALNAIYPALIALPI